MTQAGLVIKAHSGPGWASLGTGMGGERPGDLRVSMWAPGRARAAWLKRYPRHRRTPPRWHLTRRAVGGAFQGAAHRPPRGRGYPADYTTNLCNRLGNCEGGGGEGGAGAGPGLHWARQDGGRGDRVGAPDPRIAAHRSPAPYLILLGLPGPNQVMGRCARQGWGHGWGRRRKARGTEARLADRTWTPVTARR